MNEKNLETIPEPEIIEANEIAPINKMPTHYPDIEDIDPVALAERSQKAADVEKKLRQIALSVTCKNDWVDEGGKPYLQWSGASRVASILGVSYFDLKTTREDYDDKHGKYYIFECKGKVKWRGRTIEEIGTGSTRDKFFAKKFGKLLPLEEIDIPNVKKKSQTNFLNRGLKSIAGLNFTWEEVEAAVKISREEVGGKVDFKKKEKDTKDPRRKEIADMLTEMHGKSATITLQAMTTFKAGGKSVPGKKKVSDCTDKQIDRIYPDIKKQHNEWKSRKKQDPPPGTEFYEPEEQPSGDDA